MRALYDAKWIWARKDVDVWGTDLPEADEYAEFMETVDYFAEQAKLSISADSNYAVYINGALAAFGQYADYPHDKVYDDIDVSSYMRKGKNVIGIRVWYYGCATSTYCPGPAGVIYALQADGVTVLRSGEKTLGRISPAYVQHKAQIITWQMGFSFAYDANRADGWLLGDPDEKYPFLPAILTGANPPLRPRTCLRTVLEESVSGKVVSGDGVKPTTEKSVIYDFGEECVGFLCLDFVSSDNRPIKVTYGEHIVDGHPRRLIDGRDFSFDYIPTVGRNYYMNPYRRLGCRYVEVIPEGDISDLRLSFRKVMYPVEIEDAPAALTPLQQRIYDACVYTLRCCMHEHYEDCPWREQALYTMDSRNQMLAGYYAFDEYLFPKANLELIAADNRPDGLLSICYPNSPDRTAIPSFSMHFICECEEYLRYSGDIEFVRRIYPKMRSVLDTFLSRMNTDGLVAPIAGKGMWNFYEWRDGLDGRTQLAHACTPEGCEPDLLLNSLISIALARIARVESALGIESDSLAVADRINAAINSTFYDKEAGIYRTRASEDKYCKLGNALAILAGAAAEHSAAIAERLTECDLMEASLSMQGYVYDALIEVDRDRYKSYILDTIERTYEPMFEMGTGTVWETELGESDFHNAGSLCHGWSAIPIYYYHLLLGEE
ncbi:MAG: hypothetical protein IJX38_06260 [Clostridia bacterium]|nr:hypothetical protein [Clostridia bacterium]